MMKNKFLSCLIMSCVVSLPTVAHANGLNTAIEDVKKSCVGISDALFELKRMAGINTAVTGVGTATGGAAFGVGIAKAQTDKELNSHAAAIAELESMGAKKIENPAEFAEIFGGFLTETGDADMVEMGRLLQERQRLQEKSENLGNWRTGLLAANTVTNVAGALIAGENRVDVGLMSMINTCVESVEKLRNVYGQARLNAAVSGDDVRRAENVIDVCGQWETADLSPINRRARGATIASGVGAGVGVVGTITSALANSSGVRSDDGDDGRRKEKNLNIASNVMAGGATIASGTATVFNATQIGAIKKIIDIADNCSGVLK